MRSWLNGMFVILALGSVLAAGQTYAAPPVVATAKPAATLARPAAASPGAVAKPAVAAAGKASVKAPAKPQSLWGNLGSSVIMIGLVVVLMFVLFGGRAREEKKRKAMIAALKKGDRVVTMGGLIASVVDVRDTEVVLKVDESANVKERYTKSAIVSVIGPAPEKSDAGS